MSPLSVPGTNSLSRHVGQRPGQSMRRLCLPVNLIAVISDLKYVLNAKPIAVVGLTEKSTCLTLAFDYIGPNFFCHRLHVHYQQNKVFSTAIISRLGLYWENSSEGTSIGMSMVTTYVEAMF